MIYNLSRLNSTIFMVLSHGRLIVKLLTPPPHDPPDDPLMLFASLPLIVPPAFTSSPPCVP